MNLGMTNSSEIITINNRKYIVRIPGAGTNRLINRHQEKQVYDTIKHLNMSDNVVHFNEENGIKVSKFINYAHNCNIHSLYDIERCISTLREFHNKKLKVDFEFNLKDTLNYYESLVSKHKINNYATYRQLIDTLLKWINTLEKESTLCHIDCNADNFLLTDTSTYMIDWEYAAMQDPHIDIAMFAIYSNLSKQDLDKLISLYFNKEVDKTTRMKIYAYAAICSLIWAVWCDYKYYEHGINYGKYHENQYAQSLFYAELVIDYLDTLSYRPIKNAIILAAGKGTRLQPLTNIVPKPLIEVNGLPIIEHTIQKLLMNNVKDITIVVGYKANQFEYLRDKYNVRLIYNPIWNSSNNISSLYYSREYLDNTLIMDGDQIIKNDEALKLLINKSGYLVYHDTIENEWSLDIAQNNTIINCYKHSKDNHNILRSISFWTNEDSIKLRRILTTIINDDKNKFWDELALFEYKDLFILHAYNSHKEDVIEIDTLDELCAIDTSYGG